MVDAQLEIICLARGDLTPDARREAGQRVLVSRRSVLAIKPRLVPVLWMAGRLSVRKEAVSPALNGDSTKFQARPVGALILAVQIK